MSFPLVSVVIPTKNEAANIARCLDSVRRQAYRPVEAIVVDNYSTDQTARLARQKKARVFLHGPERSSQRNWGAQKARGAIVCFLDADMTMGQNVIKEAVALFRQSARTATVVIPEVSVGTNYWARVRALERCCYLNEPLVEAPRIFRKKTFAAVSGYDPQLVAAEDWDLARRIARVGTIGRTQDRLTHHEGRLLLGPYLAKKYYYARHISAYQKQHPDLFARQSRGKRLAIFWQHRRLLTHDPVHAVGVMVLKTLEYFTYLSAQIR